MITIIHGDDLSTSRNHYLSERQKTKNPVIFEGGKLSLSELLQSLEGGSLFNEEKNIFIENFFSSKKANPEFKKIIEIIQNNKSANIVFWENTELSKTDLNSVKNPVVRLFKVPQNLFNFLDGIKPSDKTSIKLFHLLLQEMEPEFIFYMVIRQFRLLLAVSDINSNEKIDEVKRLAPWQITKLKRQVSLFGEQKLREIYNKLYLIDMEQKTGKSSFNLPQAIDFFLLGL